MLGQTRAKLGGIALVTGLVLASASQSATHRYSFEGAAFDTFSYFTTTRDQDDVMDYRLQGSFDGSMRLSGYFDMDGALGANLSHHMVEFSAGFQGASFSDGLNTYGSDDFALLASTDGAGNITQWSLTTWGGTGAEFRTAQATSSGGTSARYTYEYLYECSTPACAGATSRFAAPAPSVELGIEEASASSTRIGQWSLQTVAAPVTLAVAPLPSSALLLLLGLGILPVARRRA